MNLQKHTTELLDSINEMQEPAITEREINLIKNRLNHNKIKLEDLDLNDTYEITAQQTEKGFKWLLDKWKTPRGIERKNNPFGHREEQILDSFLRFEFLGYHNNNNFYQAELGINNYVPIYRVVGNNGEFDYYVDYEGIHIIG